MTTLQSFRTLLQANFFSVYLTNQSNSVESIVNKLLSAPQGRGLNDPVDGYTQVRNTGRQNKVPYSRDKTTES